MRPRLIPILAGLLTSALATPSVVVEQARPAAGDANWPMFRHDSAGTGYSPLAQIKAENVGRLGTARTYDLQGAGPAPSGGRCGAAGTYALRGAGPAPSMRRGGAGGVNSEATPLVVNGVMYVTAANRVVA